MRPSESPGASPARVAWGATEWLVRGLIPLAYTLIVYVPYQPLKVDGGLHGSYAMALHAAFLDARTFGRDVVFTFGPWGFVSLGYHPETYRWVVATWACLAGVLCWSALHLAERATFGRVGAALWLLAIVAVSSLDSPQLVDVRLMTFPALLWLWHAMSAGESGLRVRVPLTLAVGFVGLVKFSYFLAAAVVVGVVTVDELSQRGRAPWTALSFLGGVLLFWLLAGQPVAALGEFFRYSWHISSAYSEAMAADLPTERRDVALFLAGMLLAFVPTAVVIRRRQGWRALILLPGWGALLFLLFKAGYVRHDLHELTATVGLLVMALLAIPVTWSPGFGRALRVLGVAPVLLATLLAAISFNTFEERGLPAHLWSMVGVRSLTAVQALLRGTEPLRRQYQAVLDDIRDDTPLPAMSGAVDAYPWDQCVVFAHGLRSRPRPVFQSLAAYTPDLAELNARYLDGPTAPDWILFDVKTIDSRFPALDDSRSWPYLLTRYRLADAGGAYLLLERDRAKPPPSFRLSPIGDVATGFGASIAVPPLDAGPVWAVIDVRPTVWGRLRAMAYKAPPLAMRIVAGGNRYSFRISPSMARSGFLLSPFVGDRVAFAVLASDDWRSALAGAEVDEVAIAVASPGSDERWFEPDIRVSFSRLEFPHRDLRAVPNLSRIRAQIGNLQQVARDARIVQAEKPPELALTGEGAAWMTPPPTRWLLPPSDGATALHVGFGLSSDVWKGRVKTEGVEFRVSLVPADGAPTMLWARRLDPANGPADRGVQEAEIRLGEAGMGAVLFETLPVGSDVGAPAFWSEIRFR